MGFNDEHVSGRCCFDIETTALMDAAEYLEPVEPPANYKDPIKIAAAVAERTAEALAKCALDLDLCRIVAIGVQTDAMDTPQVVLAHGDKDEAAALAAFWFAIRDAHLVGFNCLGFDLPVLLRRSLYLGIEVPYLQIDRFKHPRVTDLMQVLSYNGALKFRGLAFYLKRFGIVVPDVITGAQVAQSIHDEKWADVSTHCTADVRRTVALARRLGYFAVAA